MVEFATALLVLIPLILGIIDWGRYFAIQAVLNKATNRALLVAQTIPGVETALDPDNSPWLAAKSQIEQEALRYTNSLTLLHSGGMSYLTTPLDIGLPRAVAGDLEQALQENPISITTVARFKFFLPFLPDLDIVGRAVGYREPRYRISNPIPLDCMGNPTDSPTAYSWCPCDGNTAWDKVARACKPCDPGFVNRGGECRCDPSIPCPGNLRRDSTSCECACSIDNEWLDNIPDRIQVGDTCVCPSYAPEGENGVCTCPGSPSRCPSEGMILSPDDCSCTCPNGSAVYTPLNRCLPEWCITKPGCPEQNCSGCVEN